MRLRPCAAVRAPAAANTTPRHRRCCSKRAPDTHAAACDRASPSAAPTAVSRNVAPPDCITATMPLAEDSQAGKPPRGEAPSHRSAPPPLEPRHRSGSCPPPQKSAAEKAGPRAGTADRRPPPPPSVRSSSTFDGLGSPHTGPPAWPTSCACCISAMFSVLAPPARPRRHRHRRPRCRRCTLLATGPFSTPRMRWRASVSGVCCSGCCRLREEPAGALRQRSVASSLARLSCPAPKECGVILGAALVPCAKGVWRGTRALRQRSGVVLGAALVPCAKGVWRHPWRGKLWLFT